jgi:hypothetical protein
MMLIVSMSVIAMVVRKGIRIAREREHDVKFKRVVEERA